MTIRVISLGAGVQSTALALMAADGTLGRVDCAIFADTGWEPAAVYQHLDRLREALPFPVHVVSAGNIRTDALAKSNTTGGRFAAIPWYTLNDDGKRGIGRRQCTAEYKLRPIQRKVVELMGGRRPRGGCEMLIGISTDEVGRMRDSRVRYIVNQYPLIDRNMNRGDCLGWLARAGWSAPRSACIGCPFRSNTEWRALTPAEFADAAEVDRQIRQTGRGLRAQQFMHASRRPLSEVDLSTAEDRGQISMFNNECEGMCGT